AAGTVAATANPMTLTVSFAPIGAASNIPNFAVTSSSTPLTGSAFSFCLVTSGLPNAYAHTPYSATVSASGGTPSYTFSSPMLPAGLGMSSSGVISGTPLAPTIFQGGVTVTDSNGVSQRFI